MTDRPAGLSPALVESIAGLSAGIVSTLSVHPLDIVKTRMQIYQSSSAPSSSPTTVALIRSLTQNPRPIASLYRGLTPNLLGNATSWASFFFFKTRIERAIASWKGSDSSLRPSHANDGGPAQHKHEISSISQPVNKAVLGPMDYFVSSGLSGIVTTVLTNPIWVVKTRMLSSDRGSVGAYPSMWSGVRTILTSEGWRGFYRGLGVSLLGVSHGAVQFAVYEPAKKMYYAHRQSRGDASGKMSNEATIAISSMAKLVAGAVTYPYQVLRSRLQNYDADERFGRGVRGVATRVWTEEGIRGFYRGLVPGVIRVMPATWVTFLVYENVKFYLPHWLD